jgi:hypothetical protein
VTRRLLPTALAAGLLLFGAGQAAAAASATGRLVGGGTASISQVAANVAIGESGLASGSFECLMAGRSGFVLGDFGLAHNMIVHATPSTGSLSGSVVEFAGPASLTLDGRQKMDVQVQLWVDVATQSFRLTVLGVATLPVETLTSGQFALT